MSKLVKFSAQMDSKLFKELKQYSRATGRTLTSIYTEMVERYLRSKALRTDVMSAMESSMSKKSAIYRKLED